MCDVDCGCGCDDLPLPGGCPSWALPAQRFVQANRTALEGLAFLCNAVAPVLPAVAPIPVVITGLSAGCDLGSSLQSFARQAAFGCNVLTTAATIASIPAFVSVVGIPAGAALIVAAGAAQVLRPICDAIGKGHAPTDAEIRAAAKGMSDVSGIDLNGAADWIAGVNPDDVERQMATTTKAAPPIKLALFKAHLKKDVAAYAADTDDLDDLNDLRPVVITSAALRWPTYRPDVLAWIARGPLRQPGYTTEQSRAHFNNAVAVTEWLQALQSTAAGIPWSVADAKAIIDDPARAPTLIDGKRPVVDGPGSSGSSDSGGFLKVLLGLGAAAAAAGAFR